MGLAFWRRAEADPGWIALIEPDGTQRTAGELLARVNRLTHALRGRGLRCCGAAHMKVIPGYFVWYALESWRS